MKKFLALLLALVMALSLFACGKKENDSDKAKVKVGFITLHDENSTYDLNFINAAKAAIKNLGLTDADYILKTNIPEGQECYDTACDLAENGCNIIFADSFGHEPFMIDAAKKYENVQFCHSTGTRAHTEGLKNYHNAFASIYEGRYLAGIAAGMKLNEMIDNGTEINGVKVTKDNAKIGYVGAYPYAEVVSGYTAFFLGLQSIVPDVAMQVQYTNSWFNITAENEAAKALIADGCIIVSQHADSTGAPAACQEALDAGTTVYCVGYNVDMLAVAPTAALTSPTNVWEVFYEYAFRAVMNGESFDQNWCQGYEADAVTLTPLGESCAPGTQEKVDETIAAIKDGSLHVFDTSKFTVNGETVTTAPIDLTFYDYSTGTPVAVYQGDTEEAITDGYFSESTLRSAPYFSLRIDGITEDADPVA